MALGFIKAINLIKQSITFDITTFTLYKNISTKIPVMGS
nr:hypothetical protein [Mucilaginibacter sp. X4EP1]